MNRKRKLSIGSPCPNRECYQDSYHMTVLENDFKCWWLYWRINTFRN